MVADKIAAGAELDLRSFRDRSSKVVTEGSAHESVEEATPLIPRELPVSIRYIAPDSGKEHTATIVSRVPDFPAQVRMARTEADICGGRPIGLLAPNRQEWVRMLARVTHQFVDPPEWFTTWVGQDIEFLNQVYTHCIGHDVLFFRGGAVSRGAAKVGPRLEVTSAVDQHSKTLRAHAGFDTGPDAA